MARIPRTDLDVFPLNLGGNVFGWTSDELTSSAVLDAYTRAGGNFIDTADVYSAWAGNGGGVSEQIIGHWLRTHGNREGMVIATKVGLHPARTGLAADNIDAALDDSLRRLQTDYIDLYYLHRDDETVPIEDQVATGHRLVESGRVRHLGLSNFSPERMRSWFDTATREGLTVPVAIQPEYHLVKRRSFEQDYAPIAAEHDVAVFPYYALAAGFLTGKYRTAADLEGQERRDSAASYLNARGLGVIDALVAIAESHDAQPASVALAWLLAKGVTAPIASARTPEQLTSLLAAVTLTLTPDEVDALDVASQPFA